MDELEKQLRRALAAEDAPEGFAERVLAARRLVSTPGDNVSSGRRDESRRGADESVRHKVLVAAVLVLACAAAGGYGYRLHRGEVAKREVLLAFRIASVKLNHIQTQVAR